MSSDETSGAREPLEPGAGSARRRVCVIPGCERTVKARGWCANHYGTERAKIDVDFREKRRAIWRRKANRKNARLREQARVYVELLERGLLP